jgi:hypothetical protein
LKTQFLGIDRVKSDRLLEFDPAKNRTKKNQVRTSPRNQTDAYNSSATNGAASIQEDMKEPSLTAADYLYGIFRIEVRAPPQGQPQCHQATTHPGRAHTNSAKAVKFSNQT